MTTVQLGLPVLWYQIQSTCEYLISKKSKKEERKAPTGAVQRSKKPAGGLKGVKKGCARNLSKIFALTGKENKEV